MDPSRGLVAVISDYFPVVLPAPASDLSASGRSSVADVLKLGRMTFADSDVLVMAIVNRTRDSFYDRGATWAEDRALDRVRQAVAEGADLVDIGGVKAGPGEEVDPTEEIRRTAGFVARVRAEFPELVVSVDTWRAEVAREVCAAGADVLNDAWGGHDPQLAEVAAETGSALVCTHTNGAVPRTPPHRPSYRDVVRSAIDDTVALAERARDLGVDEHGILIDPAHDFEKNTWHSLELTRRLDEMVSAGWPVLVSLSRKDFVGETLDLPVDQRLSGTLAATAVCAWHGARVFRVHDVAETRQVLDMVACIKGTRPPARVVRGLA
jgi:dihydropteroate synthase